jgi:hypothetical protein
MLCDEFAVSCRYSDKQFCHQSDGRCRCKPGYMTQILTKVCLLSMLLRMVTILMVMISHVCQCVRMVASMLVIMQQNNQNKMCECLDGFSGDNCEIKTSCQTAAPTHQQAHAVQCQQPLTQLVLCHSTAMMVHVAQLVNAIANGPVHHPHPLLQSQPCSICALKPLSLQLYPEATAVDDLAAARAVTAHQ